MKKPTHKHDATGLLVLGMHRSGTSSLAGMLQHLGIPLPGELLPPARDNPKGFFENKAIYQFHDRLLAQFGSRWDDPIPVATSWVGSAAEEGFVAELRDIVSQELTAKNSIFAVKDPRICRFLPLWKTTLAAMGVTPKVLICLRHPVHVAQSLAARNDFPRAKSLLLWLDYTLSAERQTRELQRSVVRYDGLLTDWRSAADKISADLALAWPKSRDRVEHSLDKFLSDELRHHDAAVSLGEATRLEALASKAWVAMLGLVQAPLDSEAMQILDEVSAELHASTSLLSPFLAWETEALEEAQSELGRLVPFESEAAHYKSELSRAEADVEYLRSEVARVQSELAASLKWGEDTLAVRQADYKAFEEERQRFHAELDAERQRSQATVDTELQRYEELQHLQKQTRQQLEQLADEFEHVRGAYEAAEFQNQALAQQKSLDEMASALVIQSQRAEIASLADRITQLTGSTAWKVTWPLRAAATRSPPWLRAFGRRSFKVAWWAATGQIGARYRQRSAFRRGVGDPLSLPPFRPDDSNPALEVGFGGLRDATSAAAGQRLTAVSSSDDYAIWRELNEPSSDDLKLQRRLSRVLGSRPLFSVLVPVFRTPLNVFLEMIESVVKQTYDHWELCLLVVDEGQATATLVAAAKGWAASEPRIKVKFTTENLGISGNSNLCLKMAQGDWVVLLDHDDLLSPDALFEMARAVNAEPNAGFIYSDKDNIDGAGTKRFSPLFKPRWSPEIMLNANYLTHFSAMRIENLRSAGGWDSKTDGAQDWDVFLRVISEGGVVVHIPRVLYHWRWIETSVAAGGFEAKPYAASGQLNALFKHLPVAGWPNAQPDFEGHYIRIRWGSEFKPKVSVILVGEAGTRIELGKGIETIVAKGPCLASAVDEAITASRGEIVVLLDAHYQPDDSLSLSELVQPLVNPAIALVAGRVLDEGRKIVDFGTFFQDARAFAAFRGVDKDYYGPAGSTGWYRNASAAPGGALAFRRETWAQMGGLSRFVKAGRPDIAFTLEVTRQGKGRLLLNPFASFTAGRGVCAFERQAEEEIAPDVVLLALPDGDPFVNPNLDAGHAGAPRLRSTTSATSAPRSHDYMAEAQNVATWFDATKSDITKSIEACAAASRGPLQRVIWIIPEFSVPFYGGINTILRNAEYMRAHHGVKAVFAVLGGVSETQTRVKIGRAFPELAAACEITMLTGSSSIDLGRADAAISTLWTTAFALLKLENVRKKFYFLQDWEPLFYPSGTTSSIVEATYRFGFHAIANTPSLARSYRELGGTADHFMPAVDTGIFHARTRSSRRPGEPFVLVSYTRPGTPRNCFEALSQGMLMLKGKFDERIDIVTAGAEWDPSHFGLGGSVRNLGLIPYAETGALYRAADAGLVAMATRHPSYLPFEWMACGATVVTNRNPHTEWLLRDGINCLLCEMTRSDVFETVSRLIEEPDLRDALSAQGLMDIEQGHNDWTATCQRVYKIMNDAVGGGDLS